MNNRDIDLIASILGHRLNVYGMINEADRPLFGAASAIAQDFATVFAMEDTYFDQKVFLKKCGL